MSLAWAPSGREFVTGSYDRTVRIFSATHNTAREIYHAQRMQRVGCVAYTFDHQFCITGSDDGNLRVWKTVAHAQLEQKTPREEAAMRYRSALVKKFQHVPEVRGISKARRIPKAIKNQTAQATAQTQSQRRKEDNRIKHGQGKFKPQRDRVVVREEE